MEGNYNVNEVVNAHEDMKMRELHLAILDDDLSAVSSLIKIGADLEAKTYNGDTPLLTACFMGNLEMVKLLISMNASITACNNDGKTAFHIAAEYDRLEVLQYLVYLDPQSLYKPGKFDIRTPLFYGVMMDKVSIVKFCIEYGAFLPNIAYFAAQYGALNVMKYLHILNRGNYCNRIAFTACEYGQLNVLKYLVEERNYDILDDTNVYISRPILYNAVQSCNVNLVRYLLDDLKIDPYHGVDKTNRKFSLLHEAANYLREKFDERGIDSQIEIIHYLVEKKHFDVNATDNPMELSPLHLACATNSKHIASYFLGRGADINIQDTFGNSPLHFTALLEDEWLSKFLITNNCHIQLQNNNGMAPIHMAVESTYAESMLRVFVENGAEISIESENGDTPLHLAVCRNKLDAVKYLVSEGANLHVQNKYGLTALDVASINNMTEIARYLHLKMLPTENLIERLLNSNNINEYDEYFG